MFLYIYPVLDFVESQQILMYVLQVLIIPDKEYNILQTLVLQT
jgi:hypothetical protein